MAFLAEEWIAELVKGRLTPRGTAEHDVLDSKLFPGIRFQVKISNPHNLSMKHSSMQWTWQEHAKSTADVFILGGLEGDEIYWFVLSQSEWNHRAKPRGNGRVISAVASLRSHNGRRPWMYEYYAPTESDLLNRISLASSNTGFHLTAAPVGLWDNANDDSAAAGEP